MEGIVCACGASALELYRSSKRLIPTLLDKPRTGKVAGLMVPPRQFLEDDMTARGVTMFWSMATTDTTHGGTSMPSLAITRFRLGRSLKSTKVFG